MLSLRMVMVMRMTMFHDVVFLYACETSHSRAGVEDEMIVADFENFTTAMVSIISALVAPFVLDALTLFMMQA